MKMSLVVPTIGRPADLQRFIDHLLLQIGPRVNLREIELLVVDQSGQPDTGEMLARQRTPFRIQHLPMSGRGASRARNYGWAFAQGGIITFPDDDCHYPADLLERIYERFENPEVDGLMVQIENMGRQDQAAGWITRDNVLLRCLEAGFFVRRGRAGEVRYDELMGIGAATPWNSDEGPDLLLRLMEQGVRIDYAPDICIHHPNPLSTPNERLIERTFMYARGRGYLLRKHRFPTGYIAKSMLRTLVGSALMLLTGRPYWARYYWKSFTGKWIGLRNGRNVPQQLVTSPLVQPATHTSAELATPAHSAS